MNEVKYPYIPEGRDMLYVPENNPFMVEAIRVRNNESTDKNHSTGAVVVKKGVIIGRAANHAGFKHPKFVEFHAKGWCVRRKLKIKSGTKYWLCPGCSTHVDHAESGAVRNAISKAGAEAVIGADLYLYGHWWCCKPCWDAMIEAGIRDVYLLDKAWEIFNPDFNHEMKKWGRPKQNQ